MKKLFLYLLLFVGLFMLCYILANEYFAIKMQEKQEQEEHFAKESISVDAEPANYIVGIQDGHVIVYEADTEHVYEYTEIDAHLLQKLHPNLYEDLTETVKFNSKSELYRYLESLAT